MGLPMSKKFQFNERKVLVALFLLVIVVMGMLSVFSSGETLTEKSWARCKTLSYTKAPAFPKKGLAGASVCVTIKV